MNLNKEDLRERYKKIESNVSPVYENYKDLFSSEEREEYVEMLAQGEYELMMECLLRIINNHSIQLNQSEEDAVDRIYKLMGIDRPIVNKEMV